MRNSRSIIVGGLGAIGIAAIGAAGTIAVAAAPAERAAITSEDKHEERKKQERDVNRLRHRLRDPVRTGKGAQARRLRQIAAGQLRAENGLRRES